MTEQELIARVRGGEVNAFEPLITQHREQVLFIVARHVPPGEVAAVGQDVFVRAFLSLKNFRGDQPFGHWLARIAVRACCDFWRQQKRRPLTEAPPLAAELRDWLEQVSQAASQEAYAREADRQAASELLDGALARLSAPERMAVTMLHRDGYSIADIAAALGWSSARVKVTVFRARRKLRRWLETTLRQER